MKKLITLVLFAIASTINAQQYYSEAGDFHFRNVSDLESKSQDQLYTSAKKWLAVNFNDLSKVLKMDSKDNIIVKGNTTIENQGEILIEFTMDLAFRDNKFKMEVYDVTGTLKALRSSVPTSNPELYTIEDYKVHFIETMLKAGSSEKVAQKEISKKTFSEKYWPMMKEYNEKTSQLLKDSFDSIFNQMMAKFKKDDDW